VRQESRSNCGTLNFYEYEIVCGEATFTYPNPCRCNAADTTGLPNQVLYKIPNLSYSEIIKQTPPCPGEDGETTFGGGYSALIPNPDKWCWGQYDLPPQFRSDRAYCCCSPDGPEGGDGDGSSTNNNFIVTVNFTENTNYVINPYIMIDGDSRYFDNKIPNFYKYIQHYLNVWKQDRLNLDTTVNQYATYVDNPKCNTGFSIPGHPNFYIFNKNKGITSGNKTNRIICKNGIESENFYSRYTNIPNPDYPCKTVFTFDRFGLCSPPSQIPSFTDISKIYTNQTPNQRPKCFNEIIDYFNASLVRTTQGITYYVLPEGPTLNSCVDFHSIDFLNNLL